jgi:hypothetical protein
MAAETALEDCVRRHHVTWELGPWQELVDRRPTAVGFELRLFGQHDPETHASPGCGACASLHRKLRDIAAAVLPKEARPTEYRVEPFDASLHMRPEGAWKPEVQLSVHIVHRHGYLQAVDECEKRCVDEIQSALRGLGVQPRTWRDAAAGASDGRTRR